ncbi:MAG: HNH endonuclease [Butyrivibrio sp.]|uniref:HNH endonuclease n=1 Tax=Butyrivibrio sp. TaxID=28121 RepID=UPI0025D52A99|nr:HNH endonuclease [Butyrivibrio sp.]MCR5771711.1 HNH endonuclease [Butyrivibrio sp.]
MAIESNIHRNRNLESINTEKQIKNETKDLPEIDYIREDVNDLPKVEDEGDEIQNLPEVDDEEDDVEKLPEIDDDGDESEDMPEADDEGDETKNLPDIDEDTLPVESSEADQEKETDEERELTEEEKLDKLNKYLNGELSFEDVKEILAEYYAKAVNSNKPWTWDENVPGGDALSAKQKKEIREYAREKGWVPTVPVREENGKTYADFSEYVAFETALDKDDWNKTDREQFDKCNQALKKAIKENPDLAKQFTKEQLEQIMNGETPDGYTWHHSEKDGTMQLVPFGVHNSTNHHGGRSEGEWADAPRN